MLNCARLDKQQQAAFGSGRSVLSRYAIYYTPQPGSALANFGRSWFGRANEGATLQAFSTAGLTGLADPKISPFPGRHCGLHAVVLAPFIARDNADLDEIMARLINFAGRRRTIETGPLTLARSGRNLVLRPVEPRPALDWLAAQSINAFESFSVKPDRSPSCTHPLKPLSAAPFKELRSCQRDERIQLHDHADGPARDRPSGARLSGSVAVDRRCLHFRRDRRQPVPVRRREGKGCKWSAGFKRSHAFHRPLPARRLTLQPPVGPLKEPRQVWAQA